MMIKKYLDRIMCKYYRFKPMFNQFLFYFKCPLAIKLFRWENKTVLKIGGKINPILENKLIKAQKNINVDISDKYINTKNIVDIQSDAHSLPMLNNDSVDFVASSHIIEHLANPLKALKEWRRILKKGGIVYASIPFYKKTFDHKRPLTTIEHLINDSEKNINLDDNTHSEEFLKNFDIKKDFCFSDYEVWYKNYSSNSKIYTHYHVFDLNLVQKMMKVVGFKKITIFHNNISIEYFGLK